MAKLSKDSVILVTGTSSGIGLALVKKLYTKSYRVAATARAGSLSSLDKHGLQQNHKFIHIPLDVTNATERHAAFDAVIEKFGRLDVLINNAGISYRAVLEHMSRKDDYHQANVNYFGPMELARIVIPHMREQGGGRIINVSSVGGMMAMPTMSAYSASKFALEGASEALWYEMKPWNIHVSLIQPGFVRSDSFEHVYFTEKYFIERWKGNPYEAYYENMGNFINKLMYSAWATPESISRVILRVLRKSNPPLRVPATIDASFFSVLRRMLPQRLYHKLLYHFLPGIRDWGTPRNSR